MLVEVTQVDRSERAPSLFSQAGPCPNTSSWVTNCEISVYFGQMCIYFQIPGSTQYVNLGEQWTTLQVVGWKPPRGQQTKEEVKGTTKEPVNPRKL